MITDHSGLSPFERVLTLFTRMRPGEGPSVLLFFLHAFLLLFSYYLVKALREAFILTEFDAVVRSYAVAIIAVLLMVLVPIYSAVRRHYDGIGLIRAITVFFALNLLVFCVLATTGTPFGFLFFIWVSIFGVMVVAQFWGFAADTFNLKTGQRLFPPIMVGGNLGALVGAQTAHLAVATLTPAGLMFVATLLLLMTIFLSPPARRLVPEGSRAIGEPPGAHASRLLGGLSLVLADPYLRLLALMAILLNWINTSGEYLLADVVQRHVDSVVSAAGGTLDKATLIAAFYGNFQFWFTLVGLLIQIFLVARIYRYVGVRGALLVLPVVAFIGYGFIAFVPVFAIIQFVKIADNSLDYSLMQTTRHALFLPVNRDSKYDGKTAIDTFFWRFGDLIQAGAVFVGVNWLGFGTVEFAVLNMLLALAWLYVAVVIGRRFEHLARINVINVAPEIGRPLPDAWWQPGEAFHYPVPLDAFVDADPGDVLELDARLPGGRPLPQWLSFDKRRCMVLGQPPAEFVEELLIEIVASDVDGCEARATFMLRRVQR